eukprot:scaffold128423_cov22-Tisochrysis_lutea.AAC.1
MSSRSNSKSSSMVAFRSFNSLQPSLQALGSITCPGPSRIQQSYSFNISMPSDDVLTPTMVAARGGARGGPSFGL